MMGVFMAKLQWSKEKWVKGQELVWSFNENGDLVFMEV